MPTPQPTLQSWLEEFLASHGGVAGSVHEFDEDALALRAAHNIPPPVLAKIERVASGKGMAGLAHERREPVQTCNLKTDDSGQVMPAAKLVAAHAAVALPVLDAEGAVRGIVGIAFAEDGELGEERVKELWRAALSLPS